MLITGLSFLYHFRIDGGVLKLANRYFSWRDRATIGLFTYQGYDWLLACDVILESRSTNQIRELSLFNDD